MRQLALLALASGAAAYARYIFAPLQEAVRTDLSLSDFQMGLLQGPVIALPLLIISLPLGIAIDRTSRVRLLLFLLIGSSLGCALSALPNGLGSLILARALVGLTSLAVNPVVLSLVGDLYGPLYRGRALMVIGLGQFAAVAAAFALGGKVLALAGAATGDWRSAILYLTVPILPVVIAIWSMREPTRSRLEHDIPARTSLPRLWGCRAIVLPVLIGTAAMEITVAAVTIWSAPSLMRTYAIEPDRVGGIMAVTMIVSGILGPPAGGYFADKLQSAGGPRLTLLVICGIGLLAAPAGLFPLFNSLPVATVALILFVTAVSILCVMGTTLFIVVIPDEIRGLGASILTTVATLAVGAAPVMVSALASGGAMSLQASLAAVGMCSTVAAVAVFAVGIRSMPSREVFDL